MIDNSATNTASVSSDSASPSSSPTTDYNSGSSFVKNTPSTVLFFLAMSVGVIIALVFVFFTIRYFIRSRYGLHMYPVSYHGMMFGGSFGDPQLLTNNPSNRELSEYLDYLRANHLFREDFFERHYLSAIAGPNGGRRRRRRRRGRYSRMKKLTADEVERLFPKQLYADWFRAGDDSSSIRVDVIHDDEHEEKNVVVNTIQEPSPSAPNDFDVVELQDLKGSQAFTTHTDAESLAVTLSAKGELHFDSGNCAICLESFEDDDVVRGLICGHVFHAECVDPWLTLRRACCPICKRDYYKENNNDASAGGNNGQPNETVTEDPHQQNVSRLPAASTIAQNGVVNPPIQTPLEVDLGTAGRSDPSQVNTPTPNNNNNNGTSQANGAAGNTGSTNNNNNSNNNDDEDVDQTIDFDLIRGDPNLRALLNELIPLSERANTILRGEENNELELRARAVSNQKFSGVFKRLFWKIMGITKQDLFNWAVITIHQTTLHENSINGGQHRSEGTETQTTEVRRSTSPDHNAEEEEETVLHPPNMHTPTPGAPTDVSIPENVATLGVSRSSFHSTSNVQGEQSEAPEGSDAVRRESAEQRV